MAPGNQPVTVSRVPGGETALWRARGVPARVDDVLDLKILAVRASSEPIKPIFERMMALADDSLQCVWVFRGLEKSDAAEEATKNVA